jgi:hypothetical protein
MIYTAKALNRKNTVPRYEKTNKLIPWHCGEAQLSRRYNKHLHMWGDLR